MGGRTIEQARERMPVEEISVWREYIQKHGPLAMQRISRFTAAQIVAMLHNIYSKNKARSLDEFVLWRSDDADDEDDDGLGRVLHVLSKHAAPSETKRKLWKRKE